MVVSQRNSYVDNFAKGLDLKYLEGSLQLIK